MSFCEEYHQLPLHPNSFNSVPLPDVAYMALGQQEMSLQCGVGNKVNILFKFKTIKHCSNWLNTGWFSEYELRGRNKQGSRMSTSIVMSQLPPST